MNDPGLDEPISNDADDVENQQRDERDETKEDEDAFLEPSRWWFASTAFPLVAGTFGPMASAFSICALVVHWRVLIPPGGVEEHGIYIDDPKWLIGINAAQLAIALTSNLFLLLNMAERVRFSIAQPITIIGWYLSSFTLIGLTACASGPLILPSPPDHAYTQAFYYALFSAGLYFLVASLMVITVYGAYKGHYPKEFKLTMSQRTLMLQTISFLVYLLAGSAVFAHIESWQYLDAVYWCDFTLLTVGIGDYAPMTHLGRSLLFPFAIGGIIILGLVIGSIRSLVLERGKVKLGARMVEKERRRIVKKTQKKNVEVLKPIATGKSSPESSSTLVNHDGLTERERRQQEFELMRRIQEDAATKRRWTSLIISGTTWLILWSVGAAIFRVTEYTQNWSYFESLYFSYTSLLTIGYGDFYPQSNSGKPFFVFWSLLAIPSLTILISNMGDTIIKGIRDFTLWIGNSTILPGEKGLRHSLKGKTKKMTFGKPFEVSEQPPGAEVAGSPHQDNENTGRNAAKNDPESAAQRAESDRDDLETKRARKQGEKNDRLPENQHHYHCILVKEIGKVMKHLNSSPPRKYTFDEWAWYLKLIGEDESEARNHRKAIRKPRKAEDEELGGAKGERREDRGEKWSWLGNRSPLMGNKEETEWVLERLQRTLERELEEMRREEMERNGEEGKERGQVVEEEVKNDE
ncbi:hypothetical protein SBOR_2897 [Sclerotinia borealis F-4128]|uniref:Potassium channel domain-containing protein n=1 Tax=Sclerotinia borealis (strain F-4128) TaxID=1432307 RepID=W9CL65_SCLBF|nr:hypothetical protein SBOR_2897 [Sclerotinia borealis F-4128]